MAAQAAQTFTVVLRSTDGLDAFDKRTLTLSPGERLVIGRASKNPQKTGLMTSPSNAFIDSPVVSREHALLTALTVPPCVYISDNASMHGTLLNGIKLQPQQPVKLNTGDMVQFGQDVTRETDHFLARKFTFEVTLPSTATSSFSHGFTVPDVDTSEDEDEEVDDKMPDRPHYGSQMDPVTIADDEPEQSDADMDMEEETMLQEPAEANAAPVISTIAEALDELCETSSQLDDASSVMDDPHSTYSDIVDAEDPMWRDFEDDPDPIDDDELDDYPLCKSSSGSSNDSDVASNESAADTEYPDEDEDDNDDDGYTDLEKNNDATCRMKLKTMLNHQPETSTPQPESCTAEPSSAPARQSAATLQEGHETMFKEPEPITSTSETVYEDSFTHQYNSWQGRSPPLSRAELSKSVSWTAPEYVSPYMPRDRPFPEEDSAHEQNLLTAWTSTYPINPFNQTDTKSMFKPLGAQPIQSQLLDYSLPVKPSSSFMNEDSANQPPGQPIRRTKVSIPEIVENVVQQPPTPISELGSGSGKLKRKADVIDEEETETFVPTSPPQDSTEAVVDAAPVQQDNVEVPISSETPSVALSDRRPKKRLRKALGGAVKTVAGLLLPGTALAVGILTQLPNEFWTN